MTCVGCGSTQAVRTTFSLKHGETCNECDGGSVALGKEKKTGFMFRGNLLKKNRNAGLAKNVRHEYRGDGTDTVGFIKS